MRRLAVGLGVAARDLDGLGSRDADAALPAIGLAGVDRLEVLQHATHALGEGFVGDVHVGPERIAAVGRRLERVEQRSRGRLRKEAEIGMPGIAEGADLPLLGLFQDGDDVWVFLQMRDIGHAQHGTEAARQGHLVLRAETLVAEEEDEVIGESAADLLERRIVESGEVDAGDFRSERARNRRDLNH